MKARQRTLVAGPTGVSPKALSLFAGLGGLFGNGLSQREVQPGTCSSPADIPPSNSRQLEWASIERIVLIALLAMLTLGCCFGYKFAGWSNSRGGFPWKPKSKKSKIYTVHKSTQSQTRYTRDAATPRFVPLGQEDHGCWSDWEAVVRDHQW